MIFKKATAAILDSQKFEIQYFARFAWKRLFTPLKLGFWRFHPQNEEQYQRNPKKAHLCASPRRLRHQAWKFRRRVWPVGEFPKKGINEKIRYISPICPKAPWTDLHQIWHSHRGRQCNHLYQFFWWSVKTCGFCEGSKFASPIDKASRR